jgi:hypothetical protein
VRHAQRHWLKIQAEKAVERALEIDCKVGECVIAKLVSFNGGQFQFSEWHRSSLEIAYEYALRRSANELTKAELLHREILRRGGSA